MGRFGPERGLPRDRVNFWYRDGCDSRSITEKYEKSRKRDTDRLEAPRANRTKLETHRLHRFVKIPSNRDTV